MDTRTRTASPTAADDRAEHATPPPPQDKISAYYSLVFPHYVFYIQNLSITIGRRCGPNTASSSAAEQPQVDVDLGALKSVSRLHAKIEYDQDEDRFVLAVISRNGAWVDGVWSGSGVRAPLGERSQIQIASRTFHFVLPPPPPPEDSPSPSSQSSAQRLRSPSVDITSISPPSSQPSHTPPPSLLKPPISPPRLTIKAKPKLHIKPQAKPLVKGAPPPPPPRPSQPELPNSNAIGKLNKANSKKRKKGDVEPPPVIQRPKPEDMPPKPPFTYAQLIYRAIKDIGGKATLHEICSWIMNTYEYYRYADGTWMSSVRHNLSSGRAFLKMERCGGDRGKGFFWSIDEQHAKSLEEQELKSQEAAAAAASGMPLNPHEGHGKGRKKDKGVLEPPLKRSIKGGGMPLPPPLTSAPLPFKVVSPGPSTLPSTTFGSTSSLNTSTTPAMTGLFAYPSHTAAPTHSMTGPNPYAALTQVNWASKQPDIKSSVPTTSTAFQSPLNMPPVPPTASNPPTATTPQTSTPAQPPPAPQTAVPDVVIPIILGPIPPTHPDYAPGQPNNSAKEGYMVLHERKLILDPDVFSELTKEMLEQLEKMGARAALGVLAGHMVRALKERRARERSKGMRRPKGAKGRGVVSKKVSPSAPDAPLTNVPVKEPPIPDANSTDDKATLVEGQQEMNVDMKLPSSAPAVPSTEASIVSSNPGAVQADPPSPLIVVDDSDDEGRAAKRRKIDES